jgi:hypothetical protein
MQADTTLPETSDDEEEEPLATYERVSREMAQLAAELEAGDVAPEQK